MFAKLMRFETFGVKNIESKIALDFSNVTLGSPNLKFAKVKAIYGGNGSGKSAIINSVSLYKNICGFTNYLMQDTTQKLLKNLVNKKLNKLYFKSYFTVRDSNNKTLYYSHEIELKYEDHVFVVSYEKLSKLIGKTLNDGVEKIIYDVKDGKLTYKYIKGKLEAYLNSFGNSVLISKSICGADILRQAFFNIISSADIKIKSLFDFEQIIPLLDFDAFLSSLSSKLETEDSNSLKKTKLQEFYSKNKIDKQINHYEEFMYVLQTTRTDRVLKKNYNKYIERIRRLTKFIQIFKPELISIEIDRKIDDDYYHCNKIFEYRDYKVDIEYESTGIKKLVELFPYLERAINGEIVFIDELDANINGVFLNKLLMYMENESRGQLCFTCHDLEPINILKKYSHSIDFLGETGKLVPWRTNGHYNPKNLYVEGMIEDSPYNFEYYDFYRVFNSED